MKKRLYTKMSVMALFITVKKQKQTSTQEWLNMENMQSLKMLLVKILNNMEKYS